MVRDAAGIQKQNGAGEGEGMEVTSMVRACRSAASVGLYLAPRCSNSLARSMLPLAFSIRPRLRRAYRERGYTRRAMSKQYAAA
jgi:hypothetical protein